MRTPLFLTLACLLGFNATCALAQTHAPSIFEVVAQGDADLLKERLAAGQDPNQVHPLSGSELVTIAASYGHAEVIEVLAGAGANLDHTDSNGSTPLHAACFFGRVDAAKVLLENGADARIRNNEGVTPAGTMLAGRGTTEFIAKLVQIDVEFEEVQANRKRISAILEATGNVETEEEARIAKEQEDLEFLQATAIVFAAWLVFSLVVCTSMSRALGVVPQDLRQIGHLGIWLLLIPGFHFVWNFFATRRVAGSLDAHYRSIGQEPTCDTGASLGHWFAICTIGKYAGLPTTLYATVFAVGFLIAYVWRIGKHRRILSAACEVKIGPETHDFSDETQPTEVSSGPYSLPTERRHDLDALRAIAMLLGIALHASMSFVTFPWPVQDTQRSEVFGVLFSAIHGFRMPLFFVLSGFFTAMLWRRRGLSALLTHRYKRVFLPLMLGLVTIIPLVNYSALASLFIGLPANKPAASGPIMEKDQIPIRLVSESPAIESANSALKENEAAKAGDAIKKPPRKVKADQRDRVFWNRMKHVLFQESVFHHLWFLWFLVWLVLAFAVYARWADATGIQGLPDWMVLSPLRFLWLLPLTMLAQWFMEYPASFGPDTSGSLIPSPLLLFYYAIFFAFGAFYFDSKDTSGRVGRFWWVALPFGIAVLFPVGMYCISKQDFGMSFIGESIPKGSEKAIAVLAQATYVWVMTFGFMGFFRTFFLRESSTLRYISDSSYWLYVAHMPLIFLAQAIVRPLDMAAGWKFAIVCSTVTAILLITYDKCVRYTWLGTMLNGHRVRD